jgi:hypothetical protein
MSVLYQNRLVLASVFWILDQIGQDTTECLLVQYSAGANGENHNLTRGGD